MMEWVWKTDLDTEELVRLEADKALGALLGDRLGIDKRSRHFCGERQRGRATRGKIVRMGVVGRGDERWGRTMRHKGRWDDDAYQRLVRRVRT